MSYSRQFSEFIPGRTLGFSDQALATLNENAGLDENIGIQSFATNADEETVYGPAPTLLITKTGIPVNWNRDTSPADTTDTGVTANINNIGISKCNDDDYVGVVALKELKGYNDLAALQFDFKGEGTFHDGVHTSPDADPIQEIPFTAVLEFRSLQLEAISDAITTLPGSESIQEDLTVIDELIAQGNLDQVILDLQAVRTALELLGADSEILGLVDLLIASLEIAAAPANLPPVANDDSATTPENTSVIIPVLNNDGDPEGDSIIITSVGSGNSGTTSDNGDGTITYQPNPGFTGEDSFSYTIADSTFSETAGTDSASVTIIVTEATPTTFEELIDIIASFELDKGITNSLSSKIDSAADSVEKGNTKPAINKLEAFINEVNAQDGKKLTSVQAQALRAAANLIIIQLTS